MLGKMSSGSPESETTTPAAGALPLNLTVKGRGSCPPPSVDGKSIRDTPIDATGSVVGAGDGDGVGVGVAGVLPCGSLGEGEAGVSPQAMQKTRAEMGRAYAEARQTGQRLTMDPRDSIIEESI